MRKGEREKPEERAAEGTERGRARQREKRPQITAVAATGSAWTPALAAPAPHRPLPRGWSRLLGSRLPQASFAWRLRKLRVGVRPLWPVQGSPGPSSGRQGEWLGPARRVRPARRWGGERGGEPAPLPHCTRVGGGQRPLKDRPSILGCCPSCWRTRPLAPRVGPGFWKGGAGSE